MYRRHKLNQERAIPRPVPHVVMLELAVIAWIRNYYMDTPPLSAAVQVGLGGLGGLLVFATGVLIGSA